MCSMNESISYLKSCASQLLAHASDVERARVTCNGICMSAYARHAHLRTPITRHQCVPRDGLANAPSSDTRRTSIDGVNSRHERALHSSAARSGHLRKVVPTLGGFVCSQCLLGLGALTRGHRRLSDDTLALASAPGFGVSADTHGLTDALVSTDAARRDDACPDAARLLSLHPHHRWRVLSVLVFPII